MAHNEYCSEIVGSTALSLERTAQIRDLCEQEGVSLTNILMSACAIIHAAHFDDFSPKFHCLPQAFAIGRTEVCANDIDPANSLISVARSWRSHIKIANDGENPIIATESILRAMRYPAFAIAANDGETDHLLRQLGQRPGYICGLSRDEIIIHGISPPDDPQRHLYPMLPHQIAGLIAEVVAAPQRSIVKHLERLAPVGLDLCLITHVESAELISDLHYLASQIGLPLRLSQIHLSDSAPPMRENPVRSAFSSSTVMLVDLERWMASAAGWLTVNQDLYKNQRETLGAIPNGHPIFEANRNETAELYKEIFVEKTYARDFLHISDNAVVIDIGANIGMYSLWAASSAKNVTIYAFEPVRELCKIYRKNCELYNINSIVFPLAVGLKAGPRRFTYYPSSTLQSGLFAEKTADAEIAVSYARSQARNGLPASEERHDDIFSHIEDLIQTNLRSSTFSAPGVKLGDFIADHGLARIDMLKIDAEGAEMEILQGISDVQWNLIQQVAVEVHGSRKSVDWVLAFLRSFGFETLMHRDKAFSDTETCMVYGRRSPGFEEPSNTLQPLVEFARNWGSAFNGGITALVVPPVSSEAIPLLGELIDELEALQTIDLLSLKVDPPQDLGDRDLHIAKNVLRAGTRGLRPSAKAIVLDADGTLWGDISGEVGATRVVLSETYIAFQRYIISQKAHGRLLFISSKNNYDDLIAVFDANDMPIKITDFTGVYADWQPKSVHVAQLAQQFSISPAEIAFIDDSPSERLEVQMGMPDIGIADLPEDPRDYISYLERWWLLDQRVATAEDRLRSSFYEHESLRKEIATNSKTKKQYLTELGVKVEISEPVSEDCLRISLLSARTNQFNASLRRLSEEDVRGMLSSSDLSLSVRVSDKFGSYGLVGFLAARKCGEILEVTDFFLSCRALGRNVEWAAAASVGQAAASRGIPRVTFFAKVGQRNIPAQEFLRTLKQRCNGVAQDEEASIEVETSELHKINWQDVEIHETGGEDPVPASATAGRATLRWDAAERTCAVPSEWRHLMRPFQVDTIRVPPRDDLEKYLSGMWEELLGCPSVGVTDDLVALGGNSFTAATICSRLNAERGWFVRIGDFVKRPTVAHLADLVRQSATFNIASTIDCGSDKKSPAQPSYGQVRIWASEEMNSYKSPQVIPFAFSVRGFVDVKRLENAFRRIISRHAALSTGISVFNGELGLRSIPAAFDLEFTDSSKLTDPVLLRQFHQDFYSRPADLENGPMLHARLTQVSASEYLLLGSVHHFAADGWSLDVLLDEVGRSYSGEDLPPSAAPFEEFASLSAQALSEPNFRRTAEEIIARSFPSVDIPRIEVGKQLLSSHEWLPASDELIASVGTLSRTMRITDSTVYMAAFAILLSHAHGMQDVYIGYTVPNRREARFARSVGYFSNLANIKICCKGELSFRNVLMSVRDGVEEALNASAVPYGYLQEIWTGEEFNYQNVPFDAVFTSQALGPLHLFLDGCVVQEVRPLWWPTTFKLMLDAMNMSGEPSFLCRWSSGASSTGVSAMISGFSSLVRLLVALPDLPIASLTQGLERHETL